MPLSLTGPAALVQASGAAAFLPERRFQLLVLLALRGDWVTRDEAAGTLWPELGNDAARGNLRFTLHALKTGGWVPALEVEPRRLRWSIETDIARMEVARAAGDWQAALPRKVAVLAQGIEAGASVEFTRFIESQRLLVHARWREAALALAAQTPADAIEPLQGLLAIEPFEEDVLRALLVALMALGQHSAARRCFEQFSEQLAAEMGLEPSAETMACWGRLSQASAPPVVAAAGGKQDKLVGRSAELREIERCFAQGRPWVSLVGIGGVGKTALAMAYAERASGCQVHAVSLVGARDASEVPNRIAAALGLAPGAQDDPVDELVRLLAPTAALLVLDNCEHLLGAGGELHRLLQGCPQLRLLTTSRARWNRAEETVIAVEGLPLPDADASLDSALRFDAVRLFQLRATQVRSGFDLAAELPAVLAILSACDGLPLAIEMAASWMRALPATEVADDLAQGLDALERDSAVSRAGEQPARAVADPAPEIGVDGAGAARQGSMRAVFEQSWRLLSAREQSVLRRLSLLSDPITREGAREVAQAALPALAALVDKSLLAADRHGEYRMHPLLRQFGREKLAAAAADAQAARSGLIAHARAIAGQARQAIDQHRLRAGHDLLDHHADNLRQAVDLALGTGADGDGAWLIGQLAPFIVVRRVREAATWLRQWQRHDAAWVPQSQQHMKVLDADLAQIGGDQPRGERLAREALAGAQRLEMPPLQLQAMRVLATALIEMGRHEEAEQVAERMLALAEKEGDDRARGTGLVTLSNVARWRGDLDANVRLLLARQELAERTGDMNALITVLNNLGNAYTDRGDLPLALQTFQECLARCEECNDVAARPFPLLNLGITHGRLGDLDRAEQYIALSLTAMESGGDRRIEAEAWLWRGRVARERHDVPLSFAHLARGYAVARAAGRVLSVLGVASELAITLDVQGQLAAAAALLVAARDHPAQYEGERAEVQTLLDQLLPRLSEVERATALATVPEAMTVLIEQNLPSLAADVPTVVPTTV